MIIRTPQIAEGQNINRINGKTDKRISIHLTNLTTKIQINFEKQATKEAIFIIPRQKFTEQREGSDNSIHQRIHGEAGDGFDAQFGTNVLTVSDNGSGTNIQLESDFLIETPLS